MIQPPIECPVCFESYPYFIGHDDRNGNTFVLNARVINPADNRAHLICINCLSDPRVRNGAGNVPCPICRMDLAEVEEVLQECADQNLPRDPLPPVEVPDPSNAFPPPDAAPEGPRVPRSPSAISGDSEFSDEEFEGEVAGMDGRAMERARQQEEYLRRSSQMRQEGQNIRINGEALRDRLREDLDRLREPRPRVPELVRPPSIAEFIYRANNLPPMNRASPRPPMPWYIRLGIAVVIGACLIVLVAAVAGLCALVLRAVRQRVAAAV